MGETGHWPTRTKSVIIILFINVVVFLGVKEENRGKSLRKRIPVFVEMRLWVKQFLEFEDFICRVGGQKDQPNYGVQ